MKKILCLLLTLAILSPLAVCAGEIKGEFTATGFVTLPNGGQDYSHGNHQSRTVHTSHGDYAAYVTDYYTDANSNKVSQWTLFKVDTKSGTYTEVFVGEKYYDSSQVSLLVDKEENVWAVTSTSDFYRNMSTEGLDLRAHKLDAKTGEITSYTRITASGGSQDSYGYGMSFYDGLNNRIICMHAGGGYEKGSTTGASLNWTYLDLETGIWSRAVKTVKIEARHCYFYGFVDPNGGLMLMAQRDVEALALGYPEIGNNLGLSASDREYMKNNGIDRWAADYCWDELDLIYIPDIKKEEAKMYSVVEADYSNVLGNQRERYSLEKRLTNYYPANQNNNGGDFLWTETEDGKTLLHITYNAAMIQAAMNRGISRESIWYHQIWDITDPLDAKKLYNAPITIDGDIADEVALGHSFNFRLYQNTGNRMYLVCHTPGELTLYRIDYNEESAACDYVRVAEAIPLSESEKLVNISSHRGGSRTDNSFNVMYPADGKYLFGTATIYDPDYIPGDVSADGNLSAADVNILVRIIRGMMTIPREEIADLDRNGLINAKDLNILKQVLLGME